MVDTRGHRGGGAKATPAEAKPAVTKARAAAEPSRAPAHGWECVCAIIRHQPLRPAHIQRPSRLHVRARAAVPPLAMLDAVCEPCRAPSRLWLYRAEAVPPFGVLHIARA